MQSNNFSLSLSFSETPQQVFEGITNVKAWWSEELKGESSKVNDEFIYRYKDVHRSRMKLIEVIPAEKIVWLVLDNFFNFTKDTREWTGTKIIFEISVSGEKTILKFTHDGLVPEYECFSACTNGWTQYIQTSLYNLITTGKGNPNSSEIAFTTHEVAAQFQELAQQEKWFEIQDQLFSDDVKSIEPAGSPYLQNAEGKAAVRRKGEEWVSRVEGVHRAYTSDPVVGGNFFAVARETDLSIAGIGRVETKEIMLYEVREGKIISEQFFY